MRLYTPTNQGQRTNQINFFFCIYHQSTEKMRMWYPGRRKGGGGRGAIRCVMCEVTCQACRKNSPGTCATVRKPLSFTHELAHGRGQPPVFQACIGQWTKYIGKIKTGASFPFDPGRISSACRAGGPGFDSRDRTNHQVLKLTEN